jgi:HlyD family secretion protein
VKKNKKFIISIIVIIVVLIVSIFGLLVKGLQKSKASKDALKVRTETVRKGKLIETINAPGEIEPLTKVDISAKVSARVIELPFEEGDRVTAGDPNANPPIPPSVLVRLDSKDMESRLSSAQASREAQKAQVQVDKAHIVGQRATLTGQKARLEQARTDFDRQSKLLESHDISQSAFDLAKATLDELAAQVDAAEQNIIAAELNLIVMEYNLQAAQARVEEAEESLSYTTITAPMDGIITRLNAEVGEVVMTGTMNNPGTVILTVADLSQMILNAQVDETNVGRIRPNCPAKVHVQAFWEDEFEGVVNSIALTSSLSNTGTKYYETKILLQGDVQKLYTGLTADVDIQVKVHEEVLLVPSQSVLERKVDDLPEAIRKDNPQVDPKKTFCTVVYRVVDNKTVVTPVKVGPSDIIDTIIEAGLSEGDRLVIGPYKVLETIAHDKPIEEIKEETKGADGQEEKPKEEPAND